MRPLYLIPAFCLMFGFLLLQGCQTTPKGVAFPENETFERLSQYGLFKGEMAKLETNEGVLPYDLNSPLFSDYAHKFRTIWVPKGKAAQYNDSATFEFPVGTIISKTFYYPNDFRDEKKGRKIIETRLLLRHADGWTALPYIWNAEQTDAILDVAGESRKIEWTHTDGKSKTVNYLIPNVNQCKQCHNDKDVLKPIGPKARHLNRNYHFGDGEMNQLEKWTKAGVLAGFKGDSPKLAVWNDPKSGSLDERARAWLEINCAHCHNPNGSGGTSGLDLRASVTNPTIFGVCKPPVAAGRGSGGHSFDIVPGKPEESILVFRMETNDPGTMMPELGRSVVHEEGVQLVREWISAMKMQNCKP